MKSQSLVVVGASCVSLIVGYIAGNSGDNTSPAESSAISSNSKEFSSSSTFSSNKKSSKKKFQSRAASPKIKAERAVHNAKNLLDESAMVSMDFSTILDVWQQFEDLDSNELELALKGMEGGGAMNQSQLMLKMMLLSRWAELDGQAAAEFSLTNEKKGMMKTVGLMGTMSTWIKSDPVAAEAWYEKNKDEFKGGMFGQDVIGTMFFNALAKKDINAALNKLDLNKTSDRSQAVQAMSNLASDPDMRDKAIAKALSIEDTDLQDKILEGMIQSLSYQDPDATLALINQLGEHNPDKFSEYQTKMLNGMNMYDPEGALDYVMTEISDESTRDTQLKSSFSSLASQDSDAARDWLASNDVENKDEFIEQAVSNMSWRNPEQAMEWALTIGDDDTRTEQAADVYTRWKGQHSDGAEAWLAQQDEDTQSAILDENSEE